MNLTIIMSEVCCEGFEANKTLWSTKYFRWSPENRPIIFQTISYVEVVSDISLFSFAVPKLTGTEELQLIKKLTMENSRTKDLLEESKTQTKQCLYYRTAGGRYFKIFTNVPFGTESKSNKKKFLKQQIDVCSVIAVLSSNLWWWYYTLHFDMYNCKDYMIFGFYYNYSLSQINDKLAQLGKELVGSLLENAQEKTQQYLTTGERRQLIFHPALSKEIIDKIDAELAKHYEFTEVELDFIINYDIKYRMGNNDFGEEDG